MFIKEKRVFRRTKILRKKVNVKYKVQKRDQIILKGKKYLSFEGFIKTRGLL